MYIRQIQPDKLVMIKPLRATLSMLALILMLLGMLSPWLGQDALAAPISVARAWGVNGAGQLGDGSNTVRHTAVAVSSISDLLAVATNGDHNVALRAGGTVWTWGMNTYGQLGDGTTTNRNTPVQVPGLINIIAVAAGDEHTLALKSDGTVWAWGANGSGQLGDGSITNRAAPVQVSGLVGVKTINAGFRHSLAIRSDGTMMAWGWNGYGQLGDGTTTNRSTPVQTTTLSAVTSISGGYGHTLARRNDGTVWTWGRNNNGQLGDGTTTDRAAPALISSVSGATSVVAGDYHSLMILTDGSVRAWGSNTYGQLGDGTTTMRTTPVAVSGLINVTTVAAGLYHSLATKSDGTAWSWGFNDFGRLGDGTITNRHTPVQVSGVERATTVAAGNAHSLTLVVIDPGSRFADVPTSYWAYEQIEAFAGRGITNGCGKNTLGQALYCPDRGVTRAEMATFLTRNLGYDKQSPPSTPTFADVPANYWAYGQIEAFAVLGITQGCGRNAQGQLLFCPDRGVTRAEMAVFIDRAQDQTELRSASATFADVPPSYWAYGWIERFYTLGITTGCSTSSTGQRFFCPDRGVTRAEMAVFLIRAYP